MHLVYNLFGVATFLSGVILAHGFYDNEGIGSIGQTLKNTNLSPEKMRMLKEMAMKVMDNLEGQELVDTQPVEDMAEESMEEDMAEESMEQIERKQEQLAIILTDYIMNKHPGRDYGNLMQHLIDLLHTLGLSEHSQQQLVTEFNKLATQAHDEEASKLLIDNSIKDLIENFMKGLGPEQQRKLKDLVNDSKDLKTKEDLEEILPKIIGIMFTPEQQQEMFAWQNRASEGQTHNRGYPIKLASKFQPQSRRSPIKLASKVQPQSLGSSMKPALEAETQSRGYQIKSKPASKVQNPSRRLPVKAASKDQKYSHDRSMRHKGHTGSRQNKENLSNNLLKDTDKFINSLTPEQREKLKQAMLERQNHASVGQKRSRSPPRSVRQGTTAPKKVTSRPFGYSFRRRSQSPA